MAASSSEWASLFDRAAGKVNARLVGDEDAGERERPYPVLVHKWDDFSMFVGSEEVSKNLFGLKETGIQACLLCDDQLSPLFPKDFDYEKISLIDDADVDLTMVFPITFEYLATAKSRSQSILLACKTGTSLSCAIAISFLMQERKIPYDEAYAQLLSVQPLLSINSGFEKHLRALESSS
mmetsp:Transcript_4587/g.14024  ORF Transcript_4587/g.14024 Transcript_4587/m.14024 type:complete len:180 (+) Transcript_4587:142-681(+)